MSAALTHVYHEMIICFYSSLRASLSPNWRNHNGANTRTSKQVSMHGYLEFSDPPEHYTYPLTFPIKDWPKRNDPSFIGIFFSKCRIGQLYPSDYDQRMPGVYFRYACYTRKHSHTALEYVCYAMNAPIITSLLFDFVLFVIVIHQTSGCNADENHHIIMLLYDNTFIPTS